MHTFEVTFQHSKTRKKTVMRLRHTKSCVLNFTTTFGLQELERIYGPTIKVELIDIV